jgi:hypothetical protein
VRVTPIHPDGHRVSVTFRSGTVETESCGDMEELLDHLVGRRVSLDLIDRAFATLEPGYQPRPESRPRGRHRLRRPQWVACAT